MIWWGIIPQMGTGENQGRARDERRDERKEKR
jgi:hypothetical protein